MAINKTIARTSKSNGGMRNCIEYALRDQKVLDGYVAMTGPAPSEINWDSVYRSFLEEKRLWGKENGRLYAHNVISFHKDEKVTPEQVFEFGKEFVDRIFPDHQTLITVHQDKEHLHIHMVTNTVSYVDGRKLHSTKHDLERMKTVTNAMCVERGLSVAQKGRHFDGSKIEEGTVISWKKNKYQVLLKKISTVLMDCIAAVMSAKAEATNKDEFIDLLSSQGWKTLWKDERKHITFINDNGDKVRDSNLSRTFSTDISKESLVEIFTINSKKMISNQDLTKLKNQLAENKLLEFETKARIKELEQYISECDGNDESVVAAQKKIEQLKLEVDKYDSNIELLDEKIRNAKVIKEAGINSSIEVTPEFQGFGLG